jgi:hypothetical protein
MQHALRPRWLLILTIAALGFAATRLTATWLLPSAHQRLVKKHCDQILALPEEQAARLIARLAEKDDHLAEVIVTATADDRPLVASAAERELRSLILRWTSLPAAERSPRAARLARALATTAATLSPDRRMLAKSLAAQLIDWPFDSQTADAAQFIADCESVLLLPLTEPIEIRVAAAPPAAQELSAPPQAPQESSILPSGPDLAPSEPPIQSPPAVLVTEPTPPPAGALPSAVAPPATNEPQRFVPGRTLRISDD